MNDDDWFKIYEVDKTDTFPILKAIMESIKELNTKKEDIRTRKKDDSVLQDDKKKLLKIVTADLILEYRFALNYLIMVGTLDPKKDKNVKEMLVQLATYSMSYSFHLQELIEKLGERKGKVDFPYKFESYDLGKAIKSHIYVEEKILRVYRRICKESILDKWLKETLKWTIEKKAQNLENILKICNINKSHL